jgi:hypothetical protein
MTGRPTCECLPTPRGDVPATGRFRGTEQSPPGLITWGLFNVLPQVRAKVIVVLNLRGGCEP